jgi:hypothetical protein
MKKLYRRSSSVLLFLFAFAVALAQDPLDNFKPLQSSGTIPADFLQLSSVKYEEEKATISRKEENFDKKAKRDFYLENSFRLRELLYSGKILFNDPVGEYVNQVADKLLATQPDLRKKIRIYIVKSPAVNAFATNSGMVFINLGLLAQLETESQLAFVLSHELTHFTKKHVINRYVEDQRIVEGKNMYRSQSKEEKMLSRSNYSKELETEADLEGLDLFLKSEYSNQKLNGVFDVLQYAYLPFDDITFEKSFLESENLQFPATYFLDKVKAIAPPAAEDEEKSTHPSIDTRRTYILNKIKETEEQDKKDYLVSKESFVKVRKLARYELSSLYLSNLQYEKAIYNSYLLLREDPNCRYLQKVVAKSLYGLSKYANEEEYTKVHDNYEEVEGQSQQVFHLFEKLKPKELNAIALKYTWDLKKKYPDDKEVATLAGDLLKSLVDKHCESRLDFSTKARQTEKPDPLAATNTDSVDYQKMSKYMKIELVHMKEKLTSDPYFINYIFVKNFQDNDFALTFDKYLAEKEKSREVVKESRKQKRIRLHQERKQREKQQRTIRKKGEALGIDKIVLVNPWHAKVDQRKRKQVNYIASESAEIELSEQLQKNARLAKLEVELLGDYSFASTDVDKFNDYVFLKSWVGERMKHLDASVSMENLEAERVQSIITKYGTPYFCWTGFVNVRQKKEYLGYYMAYSIIVWPLIPYTVYYAARPEHDTYYYSFVFDIATGKPVFTDMQIIDKKGRTDVLNSTMYNTFYQLKRKR